MSSPTHIGAFERKVRALCEGLSQEFPAPDQQILFGGRTMTMAEMLELLRGVQESLEGVHRTYRAFRQAVADRRKNAGAHRTTYEDAVFFLKHQLGRENPRLPTFGVALPKPRKPPTTQAKAIARAKAAATRKARGTMGPKQRLAKEREAESKLVVFGSDGLPMDPAQDSGSSSGESPSSTEPDSSST